MNDEQHKRVEMTWQEIQAVVSLPADEQRDAWQKLVDEKGGELSAAELGELDVAQPVERALMAMDAAKSFKVITGRKPTSQLDDLKMLVSLFCGATNAMHIEQMRAELAGIREQLSAIEDQVAYIAEVKNPPEDRH